MYSRKEGGIAACNKKQLIIECMNVVCMNVECMNVECMITVLFLNDDNRPPLE